MPIDNEEIVTLSTKAVKTGVALKKALDKRGPGGATITRGERAKLLKLAGSLVAALAEDAVD